MFFDLLPSLFGRVFEILKATAPYWLTLVLGFMAWRIWLNFIRAEWRSNIKWKMIEIRFPKETYKSPAAMEMIFSNALNQTGGLSTSYRKFWEGRQLMWFSLEIVSIGGDIKFYIRTPIAFKKIIEVQVYAQYPQAEIIDVEEDYVNPVLADMHRREWKMWGTEFCLTKEDPYPIKTYIDYGLDKDIGQKDVEYIIDPMNQMIEFLGSIGPEEHVWFQILVRGSKFSYRSGGPFFESYHDWKKESKNLLDELLDKYKPKEDDPYRRFTMTKGDQQMIEAVERSVQKQGFDCGMRAIYLAPADKFNGLNVPGLVSMMKQYNSVNLNGFRPRNATDVDDAIYQDRSGKKRIEMKRVMLDAYVRRSFFYPPYVGQHFLLTSEELATIYHFPGRFVQTPSFSRIDSKKSEPPVNLPLG